MVRRSFLLGLVLAVAAGGCRLRAAPLRSSIETPPEICDGIDNDGNGRVDEPFRLTSGAYVHHDHCGSCGSACSVSDGSVASDCALTDTGPRCVATGCLEDYALASDGTCVRRDGWICLNCHDDSDCGNFPGALCIESLRDQRCTVTCDAVDCPSGYLCNADRVCVPPQGECRCTPDAVFTMACELEVDDHLCVGSAICVNGTFAGCGGSQEICDGIDNDCNGIIDDPFVNELGAYGVDIHNCGGCGVDCAAAGLPDRDLVCGGPLTDPRCAMYCPDAADGVQVGDYLDADLMIANGCECLVTALEDEPGPIRASLTEIDPNCDGADGVVARTYYVAPGGSDRALGAPRAPMKTITAAIEAAALSLSGPNPRPVVMVAAGSYGEILKPREGVWVYGGYSPDFLHRDPNAFVTEVHAPSWDTVGAGAALVAKGVGVGAPSVVDGVWLKGAAAPGSGRAAVGALIEQCGSELQIVGCTLEAGDGVDGPDGASGVAGVAPSGAGAHGAPPRAAAEDSFHACVSGASNQVIGGAGQRQRCGTTDTSGGDGGTSRCAGSSAPQSTQDPGGNGLGPSGTPGGRGGSGSWDTLGPIYSSEGGCPEYVCCGLADFLVTDTYAGAGDGEPGHSGQDGVAGQGCVDALGQMATAGRWEGAEATAGTSGLAGSGGGGGGAGGSALIRWDSNGCEFADGLGGGGGGGAAGGCGGEAGRPGSAGSPSIGVVLQLAAGGERPRLLGVRIRSGAAGSGGRGGGGGDGGLGGAGGQGGFLPESERTTPSLAGSSFGGQGGSGGAGGGGGGGGGGCGGSVVGIWLINAALSPGAAAEYRSQNTFLFGPAGSGGDGGGGNASGAAGLSGQVKDVLER